MVAKRTIRTPRAPRSRPAGAASHTAPVGRQRALQHVTEWVDAQAMARSYPDSFEAPSQAQLDAVAPGSWVKIATSGERFWIKVVTVEGVRITGVIDNDLVRTAQHGLQCGDRVTCEKRHLYATELPPPANAAAQGFGAA